MTAAPSVEPLASSRRLSPFLLAWAAVGILGALVLNARASMGWLSAPPTAARKPIVDAINAFMGWFVETFKWLFGALSWLLEWPMTALQGLLQWLPWSATLAAFTALAYFASGRRLAIFTAAALLYMVVTGYWVQSMNTLALVGVSVPLAIGLGFGLGVWGYRSDRANRIIQPCLDLMQTVPTFAYLIPILLLFGFGPVVGLVASAIYATPPMVRNVMLGLRRIPPDILDSARMCGTTPRQRFWQVEVPTALPQIMVGVNQTTMAGLSMVIIAAIIGGFNDIGWEVLSTMRKAQFGQSLLSGLVIALVAMIIDRISRGFTRREQFLHTGDESFAERHRIAIGVAGAALAGVVLGRLIPFLSEYPDGWRLYPAEPLNEGLRYVITNFGVALDAFKNGVNFFFLLPVKIGLQRAVSPFSWGIEFSPFMQGVYWLGVVVLTGVALLRRAEALAVLIAVLGAFLFFGVSGMPWSIFAAVVCLVAWRAGGWPTTAFAGLGMAFILVTGVWKEAMLSVYLCGAAVLFCVVAGGAIGVWAARSERVSAVIRPINDTLQTMPQFVFLIPVLMVFQVGDLSALIAVVAYAIVPIIRYTEHGIRNVRPDAVEAATAMGCTKREILLQVQLPMALPEIMLGLNQTILYGLGMLVIAALVGTRDLGQLVYIALGKANAGQGLVAGLAIALIAMVADRIIQAWANKKKAQLGLA